MGPVQRIRLLGSPAVLPREVGRYVRDATQANFLKQAKGSLPGMASAFRCYAAFCDLRKVAPFPALEEVVLQWSSMFNNTATFGNYVSLLEKCCFFLHFPLLGSPPCAKHAAEGLKKRQNKSSRFPNFIRSPLLLRVITHETSASEFDQAAFFSFLFSLRAPSATPVLRRAFSSDLLGDFPPQEEKALIGVFFSGGSPFLIAKFPWRKNLAP